MGSPQYFTKVTTDTSHELFLWLNEKPLRWAVLMTISARVASKDQVTTGLSKGEFFISETEYQKFGLSLSERGKLRRTIFELIDVKIIEKIENKNGNKNSTVYRFLDSDFIDCSRENREQNREQIENKQRTDREQIETNKECKNDKSSKNVRIKEYIYTFSDEVEKLFQELLLIRKAKKTPNTERAVESLRKKAQQVLYQEGEEKLLGYLDESILNGWKSFAYNFKAIEGKRHISREEEQELIKKSQLRTFLTPSEDE